MTVYVDPLNSWGWVLGGNSVRSCHLFTDAIDLTELHKVAEKIGMKRKWFQNHSDHPHYDLTESRRAAAILAGAKEVSFKEAVLVIRSRRIMIGVEVHR